MKKRIISLFLCAVMLLASASVISPVVSADKVTMQDYDTEYLECTEYDVRKYVTPFWRTNVIWNECFFPLVGNDGVRHPIKLMYKADEIISVRDYTLQKEYVRGRDYDIDEDGNFVFGSGSRIPRLNDFFLHATSRPTGSTDDEYYPRWDGNGWEYWNEGSELSLKTVAISYIHNDDNQPDSPASVEKDIPKSFEKLVNGEDFHIVLIGDSVSTGAKSSGNTGIGPYADAYPEMTKKALSMKFGNSNVKLTNTAIGGSTSDWDPDRLDSTVVQYSPDLVIACFGMNDSSAGRVGYTDELFRENMIGQVEYIKKNCPDAEILLVSSLLGNIYCFREERYVSHARILGEIAAQYEGVAFCDPQAIERFYLERKQFADLMADNMVHPNDHGMRIIAQTIFDAFRYEDISDYVGIKMEQLRAKAELDKYAGTGRYDLLVKALDDAEKSMCEKTDEWDVTDVVTVCSDRIEEIFRQCDPADHVLVDKSEAPGCDEDGRYYKECTVCGYQETTGSIPMLGGSHLWDSGFVSVPSGYRAKGTLTHTCQRCQKTKDEAIPEKKDGASELENAGMLYVEKGYNYMTSDVTPYTNGDGTVEFDICPVDVRIDDGSVSYAGVRLSNYGIAAAYNFSKQRFEIVSANLPYSFVGAEYKVLPYEWKSYKESGSYTWHKIAVNLQGNTISIYCDGELVLQDENVAYARSSRDIAMIYTIGEFYMDNFVVSKGGYDPATGEGSTASSYNLDGETAFKSFRRDWGYGAYTPAGYEAATERTLTSAVYANHVHTTKHMATLDSGCTNCGTEVDECVECGALLHREAGEPKLGNHLYYVIGRSANGDGISVITYGCAYCRLTFTEIEEDGSPRLSSVGDVNGDMSLNARDVLAMMRYILGAASNEPFDRDTADMNGDGEIDAKDIIAVMSLMVGAKRPYPAK